MLKYRKTDKMEMIWMIYVAALINHPDFEKDKEVAEKRIRYFLGHIEGLVLHDTRSARRISLYLYPVLIRILKKLNTEFETKPYESEKHEEKTLESFIASGFLRKEFEDKELKDKIMQRRHPQSSYEVKKNYEIPEGLFDFLIKNPENSYQFIKRFHSDLASTTEMIISAMQSAATTVDLFSIASKSV